jgi:hypothetical protein
MTVAASRFHAFWATYETRARIWFRLFLGTAILLALSLVTTIRAWNRPREVIRIGCDGLPALVRLEETYSEPHDIEIEAFARRFVELYARGDSYSIANDFAACQRYMRPELREAFRRQARGTPERAGAIALIEALKRRTQIDPRAMTVAIDKKPWPWLVRVEGVRQIVGEGAESNQAFAVELEIVRADRREILEGLLVYGIRSRGAPLTDGIANDRN